MIRDTYYTALILAVQTVFVATQNCTDTLAKAGIASKPGTKISSAIGDHACSRRTMTEAEAHSKKLYARATILSEHVLMSMTQ